MVHKVGIEGAFRAIVRDHVYVVIVFNNLVQRHDVRVAPDQFHRPDFAVQDMLLGTQAAEHFDRDLGSRQEMYSFIDLREHALPDLW